MVRFPLNRPVRRAEVPVSDQSDVILFTCPLCEGWAIAQPAHSSTLAFPIFPALPLPPESPADFAPYRRCPWRTPVAWPFHGVGVVKKSLALAFLVALLGPSFLKAQERAAPATESESAVD